MISKIEDKNKQIERARIFFSEDYSELVAQFRKKYAEVDKESKEYQAFLDFLLEYFLTIRIRDADMPDFKDFTKEMR